MDDLLASWRGLVGDTPGAQSAGAGLIRRWSEPHRTYHNVDHLRAVLEAIDVLAEHAADLTAVRLAAWFHDAVYDGRPGDDERASATLAADTLRGLDLEKHLIAEVIRLVQLTVTHDPASGDANGAVLCDADLAVLGGDPNQYASYASSIRAEYSHVPDEAFRAGRADVLRRLLALDPLYRTPTARARWQDAARHNLRGELALLSAS